MVMDLRSADLWRYVAALLSLIVLLVITIALTRWGRRLGSWRGLVRAFTLQQAVSAYVLMVRARMPDSGAPVDSPLVVLVLAEVVLLALALNVLAQRGEIRGHVAERG